MSLFKPFRFRSGGIAFTIVLHGLALISVLVSYRLLVPEFSEITLGAPAADGGVEPPEIRITFPYRARIAWLGGPSRHERGERRITAHLQLGPVFATRYAFWADDCIEGLTVNDVALVSSALPFCNQSATLSLDLSRVLHRGDNTFVMSVKNQRGKFGASIVASRLDLLKAAFFMLLAWVGVLAGMQILRAARLDANAEALGKVFLGGAALRVVYFLATSCRERSYDVDGHLGYLAYVVNHQQMPKASEGWQFFQQPLYYFLNAPWLRVGLAFGTAPPLLERMLQFESLVLGIAAFGLSVLVIQNSDLASGRSKVFWAAALAVLPGLVFTSARVSNDVPVQLLMSAAFFFVMEWRRRPEARVWYAVAVLAGLAFLTKNSAIGFFPLPILLAMAANMPYRERIRCIVVYCVIVVGLSWWVPIARLNRENGHALVDPSVSSGLQVPQELSTFATFNPMRFVRQPYNDSWAQTGGRQYFWEYFGRSSITGEFRFDTRFGWVVSCVLALICVFVPLFLFGAVSAFRGSSADAAGFGMFLMCLLGSLILGRSFYPYSPMQDFRHVPLLALPFFGFVVHSIDRSPRPIAAFVEASLAVFVVLCALFLLLIYSAPNEIW